MKLLDNYSSEVLEIIKKNSLRDSIAKTGLSQSKISKIRSIMKDNGVILLDNRKIKKEKCITSNILKDSKSTSLENLVNIISDIDSIKKLGYIDYVKLLELKIKISQEEIMDFEHYLQLKKDVIDNDRKVYVANRIAEIRITRELVKSELEFIESNSLFFKSMQLTLTNCDKFIKGKETRKYKVRRLVKELGDNLTNETNDNTNINNKVLQKIETKKPTTVNKEDVGMLNHFDEQLLKLRKYNLKLSRKEKNEKGNPLLIDKLVDGYYNNFKQLNATSRNKLISYAEQVYAESDECKMVIKTKEFVMKNFMIPKAIFDLKEIKLIKKEYWCEL